MSSVSVLLTPKIIKYIPLQQGLRLKMLNVMKEPKIIKYIPLQQGLRRQPRQRVAKITKLLSIFHYNKD